jgi:hypothetical protein
MVERGFQLQREQGSSFPELNVNENLVMRTKGLRWAFNQDPRLGTVSRRGNQDRNERGRSNHPGISPKKQRRAAESS